MVLYCSSEREEQDAHQHLSPAVRSKASPTSLSSVGAPDSPGRAVPIRQAISVSALNFISCRKAASAEKWGAGDALQKHCSLEFNSISPEELRLSPGPKGGGRRGTRGRVPLTRTTSTPFVLAQRADGWQWEGGDAKPVLRSQLPSACYSSFPVEQQDGFSPVELSDSSWDVDDPPAHMNHGQCPYPHCCSAEDPYFSSLSLDVPLSPEFAGHHVEGQDALLPSHAVGAPAMAVPPPRAASHHDLLQNDDGVSPPGKSCSTGHTGLSNTGGSWGCWHPLEAEGATGFILALTSSRLKFFS